MPPPPQLQPLIDVLPKLDQATLEAALRAAALRLNKRDDEIDADGVMKAFADAGVDGGVKKILSACGYLLKQAGKGGGQSPEKLSSSLGPLGFEERHLRALNETISWVKAGAAPPATATASPAQAPAPATREAAPIDSSADPTDDAEIIRQFHWAAITGATKELQRLLNGVAKDHLDSSDNRGYSAYHHACANGYPAAVEMLVEAGCDTQMRNDFGLTGWRLAVSLRKESVMTRLDDIALGRHVQLRNEKKEVDEELKRKADDSNSSALDVWTIKIEAADEAQSGGYTVYVVEVWGQSKRLSVVLRRYNEFYSFRNALMAELQRSAEAPEREKSGKIERLPFPKKVDVGVMMMGKNSLSVRTKRIDTLSQWLNGALSICGNRTSLCKFLGVSPEYFGVTIVQQKAAADYEAHGHLYEVHPIGKAKGLSSVELPMQVLFGCDETGVQLFETGGDRAAIAGEGYPYHIIHSWSRSQPPNAKPSISLEFGADQNRFNLQLQTHQGGEICAAMRTFATALATTLRRGGMERRPTSELKAKRAQLETLRKAQEERVDPQITHTIADLNAIDLVLSARVKSGEDDAEEGVPPPVKSPSKKSSSRTASAPAPAPAPAPSVDDDDDDDLL